MLITYVLFITISLYQDMYPGHIEAEQYKIYRTEINNDR